MRFPDFLIIGAMKAGTTSFYRDLGNHPGVALSEDKEPHDLVDDQVLSTAGRLNYSRLFRRASEAALCGEASTGYTKLPDVCGVAERASEVLGPELRVFYLVRDPVQRALSHHYHEVRAGVMPLDVDRAVRQFSCLIDYGCYAMQLEPWIRTFGLGRVHVIRFETYISQRAATVAKAQEWLGLEPRGRDVDPGSVANIGGAEPASRGPLWRWSRGSFYQRRLRPWLPRSFRGGLRRLVLPRSPERPGPPRMDTVDFILDRVRSDAGRLQSLLGADQPLWDLERESYEKLVARP